MIHSCIYILGSPAFNPSWFQSSDARRLDVDFYPSFESSKFLSGLDVVILAVPIIYLEECVRSLPVAELRGKLVVDVSPLQVPSKNILLSAFRDFPDIDIIVTNPMFGASGDPTAMMTDRWDGRSMVVDEARVADFTRREKFFKIFKDARCQVIEMDSEGHDYTVADAEFVTHMVGRLLDRKLLPPTPVTSKEYEALTEVEEMTYGDSFDRFFGMYKYNDRAKDYLSVMRENLASIERQLAAREAYLAAKAEMRKSDRQQLLAETRLLLQEIAQGGGLSLPEAGISNDDQQPPNDDSDSTKDLTLDVKG